MRKYAVAAWTTVRGFWERFFRFVQPVWLPLVIVSGALSAASVIVRTLGVELSEPSAAILFGYRLFMDRLVFFTLEWWQPFRVPLWLHDYLALHVLCAATELRMRHKTRFNESHDEKFGVTVLSHEDGADKEQKRLDAPQTRRRYFRAIVFGPLRVPYLIYLIVRRVLKGLKDLKRARTDQWARKTHQFHAGMNFQAARRMAFWLLVTPALTGLFFVNNTVQQLFSS